MKFSGLLCALAIGTIGWSAPPQESDSGRTEPDCCCDSAEVSPDGGSAQAVAQRDRGRVGFALKVGDEINPYRVMSVFVLPGETIELEAVLLHGDERFVALAEVGALSRVDASSWRYVAPAEPGSYAISVCERRSNESLFVNVFVMRPYDGAERVSGYRIGNYERLPLRNDPAYEMPRGLVEVTEENQDTWITPHLQLRQFLCKQESGWPKFVVLRTALLIKLEMLIDRLEDEGIAVDGVYVMSGYRTPWYNRAIGNTTRYSRHAYGDAADVFIDNDGDGRMDDLTGDGKVTSADAQIIADAIEAMTDDAWYAPFAGGLKVYGPRPHRGPFVHIDTRGRRARW